MERTSGAQMHASTGPTRTILLTRTATIGQQRVTHWPEHATYIWAAPRLARILRPCMPILLEAIF